ncbi:hypothetical protein C6495_03005 [Candidatus Poribacteria bacterium]|nr:MAG: hypothetical protein C6495_03005 [Candidatus Poribacteria bacterium]
MRRGFMFLLISTLFLAIGAFSAPEAEDVPADMVLIPAGEFQMGSYHGEADEKPVHSVYLDAFYMDKYEVTVGEYKRFVESTGHRPLPEWVAQCSPTARHPVVGVSWHDAMAYAKWAGMRLPTEAEWEKAARGGLIGQKYPWGNTLDASKANYGKGKKTTSEPPAERTTPVGKYPANGYGLYDMSGNVLEWCLDAYQKKFYANSPYRNPVAGTSGAEGIHYLIENFAQKKEKRVARGGSWSFSPKGVRAANRLGEKPSLLSSDVGFRCAKDIEP